ncbi:hypothetical protein [Nostoc commune]|uniref:hypothetical protein n=1 Tax=Nostoc commune TaxID=1178 RepID=UPI0018C4EC87|nr:hypothetical protein [Nostoc commune]MBG1260888.1 hypothetical protein [Nostoc commune BAE]
MGVSNLLQTIELTKYDMRSQRIVVLRVANIQVEILSIGHDVIFSLKRNMGLFFLCSQQAQLFAVSN